MSDDRTVAPGITEDDLRFGKGAFAFSLYSKSTFGKTVTRVVGIGIILAACAVVVLAVLSKF